MGALQELGRYGEDVAARHLRDRGMVILDRNWRCRAGEIDIVAKHGDVLVFCEVKTRRTDSCGSPAEAVTPRKLARMRVLAYAWLSARRPPYVRDLRFDVVSVRCPDRGAAQVEHLEGVW